MSRSSVRQLVYQRTKQAIENMLAQGLRGGDMLPAERELASRLGVATGTVRRATELMVSEGKLVRLPRKGTFVSPLAGHTDRKSSWAVVVPTVSYFYPELVGAIEKEARARGLTVMLLCSEDKTDLERRLVQRAIEDGAAGVLLAPVWRGDGEHRRESLEYVGEMSVPVVILDHWGIELPISGVDCVLSDYFTALHLSTTHMIQHGYTKIALSHSTFATSPEISELHKGYESALADHGLQIPELPPLHNQPDIEENGTDLLKQYLDHGVEAFVLTHDLHGAQLLRKLAKMGVKVPEDVAVIAHSDEPYAALLSPSLSSVRIPKAEMARRAALLLEHRLDNKTRGRHRTVVLRPTVVARASCGENCPEARRLGPAAINATELSAHG